MSSTELLAPRIRNAKFGHCGSQPLTRGLILFSVGAILVAACGGDKGTGPTAGSGGSTDEGGSGGAAGATGGSGGGGTGGKGGTGGSGNSGGSAGGGSGGSAGGSGGASEDAGVGGSGGSAGGSGGSVGGDAAAGSSGEAGVSQCNTSLGKALQFSGTAVDLMTGDLGADLPGGDVPRTIEMWAKFLGASSWKAEGSLIETGLAQGGGDKVLGIDISGYSGTTAQFGPYTNGYSDNNAPKGVFVMNTPQAGWLHLSWSYEGNHGKLSFTVNGMEYPVITKAGMPTLALGPGIVTLGASQTFGTQGWAGVMDEVRLWSVARTPAEVLRDMKVVLKGTEPGLVAYYRFEEGSGTFTDDVSKKPSHRLTTCTATNMHCAAVNSAQPMWVDSDAPGPFTCAP